MKILLTFIIGLATLLVGLIGHRLNGGSDRTVTPSAATMYFDHACSRAGRALAEFYLQVHAWCRAHFFAAPLYLSLAAEDFNAPEREGRVLSLPVAAATHLYAGALIAQDANGRAVAAEDEAALRVVGRAEEEINNSAGAAGDLNIQVRRGIFLYTNSAGDPVTQAYLNQVCYVEDDTIVAIDSTNKIVAGRVIAVDTEGVWVEVGYDHISATVATTVGAALVATSTNGVAAAAAANLAGLAAEAEKAGDDVRAAIVQLNLLRTDILALAAKVNGG